MLTVQETKDIIKTIEKKHRDNLNVKTSIRNSLNKSILLIEEECGHYFNGKMAIDNKHVDTLFDIISVLSDYANNINDTILQDYFAKYAVTELHFDNFVINVIQKFFK